MHLIDRLSRAQKIVIVVAFGIALETAGTYLVNLGNVPGFGWYAYSPLTSGFRLGGA